MELESDLEQDEECEIEQFEFALEKIRIWPQDINSIPDIGSSVLSLWIYIYLANGIIISTLLFIILSFVRIIPPINLFMFFIIFLVFSADNRHRKTRGRHGRQSPGRQPAIQVNGCAHF